MSLFPDPFNQISCLYIQAYIICPLILSTYHLRRSTLRQSRPTPHQRTVYCFSRVSELLVDYLPGSDKLYNIYRPVASIKIFTYKSLIQRVYILCCNTNNERIILTNIILKASKFAYILKGISE